MVSNKFNKKLQAIKSDNGSEHPAQHMQEEYHTTWLPPILQNKMMLQSTKTTY